MPIQKKKTKRKTTTKRKTIASDASPGDTNEDRVAQMKAVNKAYFANRAKHGVKIADEILDEAVREIMNRRAPDERGFSITGGGENLTAAQALTLATIDANRTGEVQHITNARGGRQAVHPNQRGIGSRD